MLRCVEEVLDFSKALFNEPSKPSSVCTRRTLEGSHVEEDDMVSLDDVGDAVAILGLSSRPSPVHLHNGVRQS